MLESRSWQRNRSKGQGGIQDDTGKSNIGLQARRTSARYLDQMFQIRPRTASNQPGFNNEDEVLTLLTPFLWLLFVASTMDINRLANLRLAYEEVERRVHRALNTQVGDSDRLTGVQNEVLLYSQAVEQVGRIYLLRRATINTLNAACRTLLT